VEEEIRTEYCRLEKEGIRNGHNEQVGKEGIRN
jgi:hypothetical protein